MLSEMIQSRPTRRQKFCRVVSRILAAYGEHCSTSTFYL